MSRLRIPLQAAAYALIGLILTLLWWVTGHARFWPCWFWLSAVFLLMIQAGVGRAAQVRGGQRRGLAIYGAISASIGVLQIGLWALSGAGVFWPVYGLLGMALVGGLWALIVYRELLPGGGQRELSERVDELTRTRRGALDVQDAQLRRIERDLHDGAQARLVALTMQIGRAQEQLDRVPAAAELLPDLGALLGGARAEAQAAITELRELARGIAPPLLADRGLAAAVQALSQRSALAVEVETTLTRRPPAVIETAAYFVAAESLTNAAKHAPGASACLRIAEQGERLIVEVSDDGPGGADPTGSGLSGLRQRVAALDGTMELQSPPGGGTRIHVELPCVL